MNIYDFNYCGTNIKMNLPYKNDYIMRYIIKNKTFWEDSILKELDNFLSKNREACIDIGANIGNHSLYFSKILDYKNVYSFEPQLKIFDILKDNIIINNCVDKIIPYNVGLYNKCGKFKIKKEKKNNCGCVSFEENSNGDYYFHTLDEYNFKNITLLKIDVEGLSYEVLKGSEKFFAENNPLVWLEMNCYERDSYKAYREFVLPTNYLMDKGFKLFKKFKCSDYFFMR